MTLYIIFPLRFWHNKDRTFYGYEKEKIILLYEMAVNLYEMTLLSCYDIFRSTTIPKYS